MVTRALRGILPPRVPQRIKSYACTYPSTNITISQLQLTTIQRKYHPIVPLNPSLSNTAHITMDPDTDQQPSLPHSFPDLHIIEPTSIHTHTAILLHGRGSDGPEFAEELLEESKLPGQPTLAQTFPAWRFVFPSSRQLWSTLFEEDMPAWFEAHSLTDITSRSYMSRGLLRRWGI